MNIDIPLRPLPSDDWQREHDKLLEDPYLRKKYDRRRGLVENADFIMRYCPEVFRAGDRDGLVVDIGPGFGHFMEIARGAGWDVLGVDAPTGDGGMGDEYRRLAGLLWRRQGLEVHDVGWQKYVEANLRVRDALPERYRKRPKVLLFCSRGSWEQCYAEHLDGEPHHVHHDSKRQAWQFDDDLIGKWRQAFDWMAGVLVPGGAILIHGNGTDGGENERQCDRELRRCGEWAGLRLVLQQGTRLWKWRKG